MVQTDLNNPYPEQNSSDQPCDTCGLRHAVQQQLDQNYAMRKPIIEIRVQKNCQTKKRECPIQKAACETQCKVKIPDCPIQKPVCEPQCGAKKTKCRKKPAKPLCDLETPKPSCNKKPVCETKKCPECPVQVKTGPKFIGNALLVAGKGFIGEEAPSITKPPRELNLPRTKLYDMTNTTGQTKSDPHPYSTSPPPTEKKSCRVQSVPCKKKVKKSLKCQVKPKTCSGHADHADGCTIVTVRDQCCSTNNFQNECANKPPHPRKLVERAKSTPSTPPPPPPYAKINPTPSSSRPELISRASSALFKARPRDQTTQDDLREPQEPVVIFEKLPEKDLRHWNTQTDAKQLREVDSQTVLNTRSNSCQTDYETADNFCQTDETDEQQQIERLMRLIPPPIDLQDDVSQTEVIFQTDDTQTELIPMSEDASQAEVVVGTTSDYGQTEFQTGEDFSQTEDMEDLKEEKEKIQNLMHLIPLPTIGVDNNAKPKSNLSMARSMEPPTGTCAPKMRTACKPNEPKKLDRCNKCNKFIADNGCGCGSRPTKSKVGRNQCTKSKFVPLCRSPVPRCPTNVQRCGMACQTQEVQCTRPLVNNCPPRTGNNECSNPLEAKCSCSFCAKEKKKKKKCN